MIHKFYGPGKDGNEKKKKVSKADGVSIQTGKLTEGLKMQIANVLNAPTEAQSRAKKVKDARALANIKIGRIVRVSHNGQQIKTKIVKSYGDSILVKGSGTDYYATKALNIGRKLFHNTEGTALHASAKRLSGKELRDIIKK
jgi:hypothetical protein